MESNSLFAIISQMNPGEADGISVHFRFITSKKVPTDSNPSISYTNMMIPIFNQL